MVNQKLNIMTEKKVISCTDEIDGVKAEFEVINGIVKTVWIGDDIDRLGSEFEFDERIAKLKNKLATYEKAKEFFMEVLEEAKNDRT